MLHRLQSHHALLRRIDAEGPELLKIDPPDGLTILRGFLQWAAEQKAAWNWAMHLRLYCWLLQSPFGAKVTDEHLEVLMDASAARWTVDDTSANRGILLASQGGAHITQDWKAPQAGAGPLQPPMASTCRPLQEVAGGQLPGTAECTVSAPIWRFSLTCRGSSRCPSPRRAVSAPWTCAR